MADEEQKSRGEENAQQKSSGEDIAQEKSRGEENAQQKSSGEDIVFDGVSKRFEEVVAIDRLTLHIPQGKIFGFLGPNGAGKTTCLRMLLSIILPDEGEIRLFDGATAWELRDRIGYLPEERGLYRRMYVLEHLLYLAEIKGQSRRQSEGQAREWLERFALLDRARSKVMDLSKGNQQKVQFIGALIHNPSLLVLDEVFAGLDPVNTQQIREILLELRQQGKTIVFSTHVMEQAEQICDSICLINKGRPVLEGSLQEIKRRHGRNRVRLEHFGSIDFLSDHKDIRSLRTTGNQTELRLAEGASPQEILRLLVEHDVEVRGFHIAEPSLNELFLEMVQEKYKEGAPEEGALEEAALEGETPEEGASEEKAASKEAVSEEVALEEKAASEEGAPEGEASEGEAQQERKEENDA